jgi:hypothetical protein
MYVGDEGIPVMMRMMGRKSSLVEMEELFGKEMVYERLLRCRWWVVVVYQYHHGRGMKQH